MTTLPMKKGDRLPVIDVQLIGADGGVMNLTTATGVTFTLASQDGRVLINKAPATIVTPATGMVRYSWAADDLDEVGAYLCEWIVTFPGALEMTFPNKGYDRIELSPRLS